MNIKPMQHQIPVIATKSGEIHKKNKNLITLFIFQFPYVKNKTLYFHLFNAENIRDVVVIDQRIRKLNVYFLTDSA